jgi:multisubunit Na+/H+ antiporter MnhC subunit
VARTIVHAVDAVAIVIGFAMFAILLWMIEGIDRI